MRYAIFAWAFFCLWHPRAFAADEEPAPRKISAAESVLAIYPEDWGLSSRTRFPAIILAIWPDGHIVWSKDRIKGGAPYYSGRVDREQVAGLLLRFERDGLFSDKKLNNPNFGEDSHFTTLFIKSGKRQVEMSSWHEVVEANGKIVATSHGATPLEGRHRLEVIRNEPADYLHFRFVWAESRGKMIDLIPVDGKPIGGSPIVKDRALLWQEAPLKNENNRDE
jgi:hypothetical protein